MYIICHSLATNEILRDLMCWSTDCITNGLGLSDTYVSINYSYFSVRVRVLSDPCSSRAILLVVVMTRTT